MLEQVITDLGDHGLTDAVRDEYTPAVDEDDRDNDGDKLCSHDKEAADILVRDKLVNYEGRITGSDKSQKSCDDAEEECKDEGPLIAAYVGEGALKMAYIKRRFKLFVNVKLVAFFTICIH